MLNTQKNALRGVFFVYNSFIMIYGYIRVSSDKQTVENQRFEITEFCRVNNLTIDGWIEETISDAYDAQHGN